MPPNPGICYPGRDTTPSDGPKQELDEDDASNTIIGVCALRPIGRRENIEDDEPVVPRSARGLLVELGAQGTCPLREECEPLAISTVTEWRDLDIRVDLRRSPESAESAVVAIEHKIKAREHDDQLDNYDRELATTGRPVLSKILLSFTGDTPQGGTAWRPASYVDLLRGLDLACDGCEHRYLTDYRRLVLRLVAAHRLTTQVTAYAQHVFGDDADDLAEPVPGFVEYVTSCRLRVTLQRAWFGEVVRQAQLRDWTTKTDETNGAGLVDFARVKMSQGTGIRYGLQLQNWSLKAFAQPWPYPESVTAAERVEVDRMLERISAALGIGGRRPSSDRGRGFRSFRLERTRDSSERYNVVVWGEKIRRMLRSLEPIATGA